MSSFAAAFGLALATTTAVVLVINLTTQYQGNDNGKKNVTDLYRNPTGPDVQFILFLRNNSYQNLITGDLEALNNSGFDTKKSTKIITHGFKSSINEEVFQIIKNAYMEKTDVNIIGMDWSVLCDVEYLSAMKGVEKAGRALSNFINFLSNNGVDLDDVHLIGHSLGAHVMGVAGDRVLNGKVGRITGLDPAGPGYNDIRADLKLDPEDGKLVEVVHTYMKVLSLDHPLGHVDFYPNGGRFQPGCPDIYEIMLIADSIFCNHGRAFRLFAETIKNEKSFKSKKCKTVEDALYSRCFEDTEVYMGHPETYQNGLYFFKTASREPYSLS